MGLVQDWRLLRRSGGFVRLVSIRLLGQSSDGALQAGLASLFFFSPERASTPGGVALAFAVMLGPFTLFGPWTGVFLDRWSRRAILVWANQLRAALGVGLTAIMASVGINWTVYALSLVLLSLNRLVLAVMPATQPRLIARQALLTANALAPTMGTIAAGSGALIGLGVTTLTGLRWPALALASLGFAAAGLVATGFTQSQLGPDSPTESLQQTIKTLVFGLADGVRQIRQAPATVTALAAMALTRIGYALVLMASILISRNLLSSPNAADAGLGPFSLIVAFAGAGFGVAALVSPLFRERLRPERWIVVCLLTAAATQGAIASSTKLVVLLPAGLLLSAATQGIKIATDTIVQRDINDAYRGRAFTIYDMLYNLAFLLAAGLASICLPPTGHSWPILTAIAAAYLAAAGVLARRSHPSFSPRP